MNSNSTLPRVLTIAGSDSSGGAGIEADLKTFTVHGCYGMTCITGLTAQNTQGVRQIYPVDSQEMIKNTLDAVFEDIGVDAVKTGMLTTVDTVKTVISRLQKYHTGKHLIVDPVMVSTSGARLISEEAIDTYIEQLFPLASLITPNLIEAIFIHSRMSKGTSKYSLDSIKDLSDVENLARKLHSLGCRSVLIKGGHGVFTGYEGSTLISEPAEGSSRVVDIFYDGKEFKHISTSYVESKNTHGTGCTLASAIACNVARGSPMYEACCEGIRFVHNAITHAPGLGEGYGPVNHMHNIHIRPFAPGSFIPYLLNHPKVKDLYRLCTNHPFTARLGDGTLSLESFKFFLMQDYKYLVHYSRAHALAGFKAHDVDTIAKSSGIIFHIKKEMELHIAYCEKFGLSKDDLDNSSESLSCYAYSRYLLDVGNQEDWFALQMALLPCLLGYLDTALNIKARPSSIKNESDNPYWRWVENYTADDYREAVKAGHDLIEKNILNVSPDRVEELINIFVVATKMEIQFWTSALEARHF